MLTLVAGCGATTGSTIGDPCGPKQPCGKGAVCDMTDPGGPVCIDADGDLDGDGIPNGQDFCEHMPGGRYDEDADGIGDECDPCPIAPPPATPDPDGDAVDSPCDPDSLTPGDRILLFDGFDGDTLDPRWKATTGAAWSISGDGEVIVDLSAVTGEDYLKQTFGGSHTLAVLASYRIDSMTTSTTTHTAAIETNDPSPAGVAQLECGLVHSDSGTTNVLAVQTDQNNASSPTASGFDPASLYELAADATGGMAGCTAIGDGQPLGAVTAPISVGTLAEIALGARGVRARFQWVLVVARGQ